LEPFDADIHESDPFIQRKSGCTIFLGFTSNMVSSGVRESIRFLVQHRLVDCIVTTAGAIEEDIMKVIAPHRIGAFGMNGANLRKQGVNRIGNILVPNDNYCEFQDWLMPLLDRMLDEKSVWTPSAVIQRLGETIASHEKCEESIWYWAARNQIPVFCPALSDGALGDVLAFHSFRKPDAPLVVDLVADVRRITSLSLKARMSGVLIAGGGVVKHHIANANLMRNGADFCVFINSCADFDGSDTGASPDEAISWGKIRPTAASVKVTADASLILPLLVAQSFAPFHFSQQQKQQNGILNDGHHK
jgi:deoxyhypusine synthase